MARARSIRKRSIFFGAVVVMLATVVGGFVAAQPSRADCNTIRSGTWSGTCGGAYRDCEVITCRPSV
jgi:hypothetical protein